MAQRPPADIRSQHFHFPGFAEFQRFAQRNRDRIGLFAGGAARAPDPQHPRILPKHALFNFRHNPLFQGFVHRGITKKRSFLGQQLFQQRFVLDAGALDVPQQIGATRQMFFFDEIQQPGREKTFARRIEQNRRALFDQRANLIEFGLAEPYRRGWIWCHVRRTSMAAGFAAHESKTSPYRFAPTGAAGLISSTLSEDRPDLNCARASFSCSDSFTMLPTVEAVWRAPCVVWRVMPEMICIALATPSVPRPCCFEAREIS